jgi:hypothetical protein
MQKKKISIPPILFLYYEESACPLLLNFNKVYFASSLIAKPTLEWSTYLAVRGSEILPHREQELIDIRRS